MQGVLPHPFTHRAFDNTVPQFAFLYFAKRTSASGDTSAKECFRDFVNAYINTPTRCVPLPGAVATGAQVDEPFITLWQAGAVTITNVVASGSLAAATEETIDEFIESVAESPGEWARWLAVQLGPEIAPAYQLRLGENWKVELAQGASALRPLLSSFANDRHELADMVLDPLRSALDPVAADGSYREYAQREKLNFTLLALSYGLTWFERGRQYRLKLPGVHVRFHELRDRATCGRSDSIDKLRTEGWEFDWAPYLEAYLELGLFPREAAPFCEALTVLADTCAKDAKFESRAQEYRAAIGTTRALGLRREAVAYALSKAGMPPPFRDAATRNAIVDGVSEASAAMGGELLRPLVAAVVRIAGRSSMAQSAMFSVVQRVAKRSVWKLFVLPGAS